VVEEGGPVIQAVIGDGMDRQLAKSGQPVGWPREPLGCLGVVADALIGVRPFVAAARVSQEPIAEIGEVVSLDGRAALMGSIDHIRATPGYPDGRWPQPMSLEQNLADLQRHHDDSSDRVGFTYTVLEARGPADRADVIGCVYIYPDDRPGSDVHVQSWVRADLADLDALLATTVREWLEDAWPWRPEQIRDHPRHTAR
jgi:hypothetical protein